MIGSESDGERGNAGDIARLRSENAELRERLEIERRERDELYLLALRYLAVALDAKDVYTRGHAQRVTLFSRALAARLAGRDTGALRDRLALAGMLHDVGKVWVPDAVLKKPGGLSNDEWYVMKQHPVLGEYLLGSSLLLQEEVKAGVRGHHERPDGRGYPDGLRGDSIPEISRIIGVCDAFDAMTLQRVYRPTVRKDDDAVRELHEWTGKQFDGEMVAAFAAAHDAGEILVARGEYFETEMEPGAWNKAVACYRDALQRCEASNGGGPAPAACAAGIRLRLGRVLARQRRDDAIEQLEIAVRDAGDAASAVEARVELALAHYNRHDRDRAAQLCDEVLREASEIERGEDVRVAAVVPRALHIQGLVYARKKMRPEARRWLKAAEAGFRQLLDDLRAIDLTRDPWRLMHRFEEARDVELRIAHVLDSRATVLLDAGDSEAAAAAAGTSMEIKARLGDFYGSALTHSTIGLIHMCRGELGDARSNLAESLRLAEMVDDLGGQNVVHNRLGELLTRSGEVDRAIEHLHLGLSLAERLDRDLPRSHSCVGLARAFVVKGDAQRARQYADRALEMAGTESSEIGALAYLARAQARALLDDALGARGDLARAEAIARPLDVPWEELEIACRYRSFLEQQGDSQAAAQQASRIAALSERLGKSWLDGSRGAKSD